MPVLHLDPIGSSQARRKAGARWPGQERLREGPSYRQQFDAGTRSPAAARHGRDAAGHAIEQAMADIAEGLVQSGVRRLVVAVVKPPARGGIDWDSGFLVGAEIAAGVPCCVPSAAKDGGDVAGAEIRKFRRTGIFLRRPLS